MIFVVIGVALIAINVFALSRDKNMHENARQLGQRMHSRLPFIFREPEYYEDVGRAMNLVGLAAGIALILWGIVS
jgi:hypothetical protein